MDEANSPWGAGARVWVRMVTGKKGNVTYQIMYRAKRVKSFRSRNRAIEFVTACNKLFD